MSHAPKEERATLGVKLVLMVWLLMLFDPQWLLAMNGAPTVVLKGPVLLYMALLPILLLEVPARATLRRRWHWFTPVLVYLLVGVITTPFAVNNGYAREVLQEILLFWLMMTATIALVNGARRTEQLFLMYGLAFLWFGLWGGRAGYIWWHHVLANQDGFGAFMVLGLGFCSFMAMAAAKGRFRHLMLLSAAVSIVGVVASFARGAFLAAIAVFAVVFLRSSRKGMTLLAGLGAVVLIIVAAETIHPGMFWLEMQSAFSEGTEEGTGEDRWELWMAAVEVFWQRPIFGVGFNNFGPFAASYFSEGDVGGRYAFNVGGLYNRSLHSLYFQTLSETGIVGSIAFIWILVDFWKRNKVLRTAAAQHYWSSIGGTFRLRQAALALELGMVGFLTVAALYSTAGKHWLWTLLALNVLLHRQVVAAAAADGVRLTGASSAAARRKAAAQSAAAPTPELIAALAAAGPPASEQRP